VHSVSFPSSLPSLHRLDLSNNTGVKILTPADAIIAAASVHLLSSKASRRDHLQSRLRLVGTRGHKLPNISTSPSNPRSAGKPAHQSFKHTSFCARWFISSARSCSTIICSSLYASAQGTPSSSALVLTTHSVLPPNNSPLFVQLVTVSYFETSERRVDAGMMSFSALMRSYSVSSATKEDSDSRSDSGGN